VFSVFRGNQQAIMSPFETVSYTGVCDDFESGTALGTAVENTDRILATLIGLWPTLSPELKTRLLSLATSASTD
jgi:hypothetical protein